MNKNKDVYRVQSNETYTLYTKNGVKHSVNGPALTIGTDSKWYYIDGKSFTEEEHTRYIELYKAYEGDPLDEAICFNKASTSSDGIFISDKGDSPAEHIELSLGE